MWFFKTVYLKIQKNPNLNQFIITGKLGLSVLGESSCIKIHVFARKKVKNYQLIEYFIEGEETSKTISPGWLHT